MKSDNRSAQSTPAALTMLRYGRLCAGATSSISVMIIARSQSSRVIDEQSHLPVICRPSVASLIAEKRKSGTTLFPGVGSSLRDSWLPLRSEAERKGAIAPKLCGFAGIESRGSLLEESGNRLTSVRRAHSFVKLPQIVLGSLCNMGPGLTAKKLFRSYKCS
jgi:hypothetical protein